MVEKAMNEAHELDMHSCGYSRCFFCLNLTRPYSTFLSASNIINEWGKTNGEWESLNERNGKREAKRNLVFKFQRDGIVIMQISLMLGLRQA